jgi:hypothetical protein
MDQATYEIVYNALWRRGMSHEDADLAARQAAEQMAAERYHTNLVIADMTSELPRCGNRERLPGMPCILGDGHAGDHRDALNVTWVASCSAEAPIPDSDADAFGEAAADCVLAEGHGEQHFNGLASWAAEANAEGCGSV